ncbi:hypothetical protein OZK63_04675 [Streptomyces sp. UMAF16]|nr:hypothetical protein [Streptomyces sp. UMAF16]
MPRPRKKGRRREVKKVPRSEGRLPEYDRRACPEGLQQARYVSLSDFHVDRVDLQRPADFIKETMLQLAQAEPDFVTTEPYSTGTGTRFLVQPHPRRS